MARKNDHKSEQLTAGDLTRERMAIYCRVSSEEQAQAGTIDNQVDFARRTAGHTDA